MAEIIRKIIFGYNYLFDYLPDSRTKSWLFVAKPYQGLTLLGLYLMFVLKWGPKWMQHRQPYNLDKVIIAYNTLQIVCCGCLFIAALQEAWFRKYKWFCEPIDFSKSEHALNIANIVYYYYLLKYLDLLDTIFFILRKKFKQISFLHLYHHTGMVLLVWGSATYLPGGHGSSVGVINCFVHVVMYSYYLLTVAAPKVKNYLWLKKYVTQIQIIQFMLNVIHVGAITFIPDCAYPRWTVAVFLPQNMFMLVLFIDFYIKTYIRKPKKTVKTSSIEIYDEIESNFDRKTERLQKIHEANRNLRKITRS